MLLPPICSCPVLWQSQPSMLSAARGTLLNSPNRFVWVIWAGSSMGYAGQVLLHMVHHTQDAMSHHNAHEDLRILSFPCVQDQNDQPKGFGFDLFIHSLFNVLKAIHHGLG